MEDREIIDRLRAALRPFAEVAGRIPTAWPRKWPIWIDIPGWGRCLTAEDWREAGAALEETDG